MFKKTQIKITILIIAFVMMLNLLFSFFAYRRSTNEIFKQFRQNQIYTQQVKKPGVPLRLMVRDEIAKPIKTKIITNLITLNIIILGLTTYPAYLLAGLIIKPLKQSQKLQKDFIANASHQLKTPLSVLKAEIDLHKLKTKRTNKFIKSVEEEVALMTNLIDKLIKQNKVDNITSLKLKKQLVNKAVKECVLLISPLAKTKGIKINCKYSSNLQAIYNKESLKQALLILLENAIKHNDKKVVNIQTCLKNNFAVIKVTGGKKIHKANLKNIFNRFYQVKNNGGYGLGLSLAKDLVTLNKGKIVAQSDTSTTFIIYLKK